MPQDSGKSEKAIELKRLLSSTSKKYFKGFLL